MENLIRNIFGKTRAQQDRETIVRIAEEKHELKRSLNLSEERKAYIVYEAVRLIEKRSPEGAQYFWNKFHS